MKYLMNKIVETWFALEGSMEQGFMKPLLQHLDLSLFQNIILGVLAIFIPFAIVTLTGTLNRINQKSRFEKMVLEKEVLRTRKLFWISISGIAFLSFFNGDEISTLVKLIVIVLSGIVLFILYFFLERLFKVSDGYLLEFGIKFLNRLKLSGTPAYKNESIERDMKRAWDSFWDEWAGELSISEEEKFTKIFVGHIDDAIENKKYVTAASLVRSYKRDLTKNDVNFVGTCILQKSLEWYEKCLDEKKKIKNQETHINDVPSGYLDWISLSREFFSTITLHLLHDSFGVHLFFQEFNRHIQEKNAKNKSEYVQRLIDIFCDKFFNNITQNPNFFVIWKKFFLENWKITMENSKFDIPRMFLISFLEWTNPYLYDMIEENNNRKLTQVIRGLFPSVRNKIFSSFLMLYFYTDIHSAIKVKNYFHTSSPISSICECPDETLKIIIEYFGSDWRPLEWREDLLREDREEWHNLPYIRKRVIANEIRIKNLTNILKELKSNEINEFFKNSEDCQDRRDDYIKFIELIIEEVRNSGYSYLSPERLKLND